MEKILIVDDEMFSRMAIEDILRAEWSGIEVFSARGAEEALGILEREEIALLMTDIKMPGMNGLELLAEVRRRGLSMEVVILSSYNEFDLVRQAMKLGTFDYLFKPAMLPPDIIEVVKKALQKQREKSSSRMAESDRKRLSRDREQFFRDLISAAGIGRTWFEERAAAFGLPEPVGKNAVVVFRLIRYRKSMAEIFKNDVSLLRSSVCNVMSEALDSVKDCQFLCNKFDEYVWIVWEAREDGRQEFYERLEALIRTAADFLSRYYGLEFSIGISRSSASLFDCCQGYTEAADNGRESETGIFYAGGPDSGSLKQEMRAALDYIRDHLGDKDLSLQTVADQVGISRNYFSRIFKEVMGVNFIDYVTRLRVEKARSLYMNTDMKIYEIAELVGYSDWHYLYSVYKKQLGHSMSKEKRRKNP
ncbi:response regulator transcription factor [Hungatella hathewayi]|uniref:response regulator transcription factor n=1 Tax=Hungatella hathewayi TaxID=154046 RepID=UPI00356A87E5